MTSTKPSIVVKNTADGYEDVQTMRVVSDAEERGYADWIHQALISDPICESYFPMESGDIYQRFSDGLLFCKMINFSVPDTIDVRAINTGKKLESVFCKNENLSLAVQSAAAVGCCVVNIGPIDLGRGVKHIVLGLLWQIIRIGLIGNINLVSHAELVALLKPGETLVDLRQLSPEELLIRWVNYHLEKANVDRRIHNFTSDIMDSEIYAHLLNQIAPNHARSKMKMPNQILSHAQYIDRAENLLNNASVLNAHSFVQAEDIANANQKGKNRERLNMAFVANLFNLYPSLDVDKEAVEDYVIREETLEEKTYRNWMNSMGVEPYVNDIYADLRNGLILLYLIDVLKPNTVNWDHVYRKFNPMKKLFQMQENCNLFISYAKKLNIKIVNLAGENIRESDQTLILGLCFQLLRTYTFQLLHKLQPSGKKPIEDKDIIEWANSRCVNAGKSESQITSFRDFKISSGIPIADLIDAIKPGSVEYSNITGNKVEDANYLISIARRCGANIYALPQHIVDLNSKMILTIYACLMLIDLKQ